MTVASTHQKVILVAYFYEINFLLESENEVEFSDTVDEVFYRYPVDELFMQIEEVGRLARTYARESKPHLEQLPMDEIEIAFGELTSWIESVCTDDERESHYVDLLRDAQSWFEKVRSTEQ